MSDRVLYMDNAATTPVDEHVLECMIPYLKEYYGNPSSIHLAGQRVKKDLNAARKTIASVIGADASEIYFTSGGSESDNWAIMGAAEAASGKGKHIITTKIEHHAVLNTCAFLETKGYEVTYLDVDDKGMISLRQLENSVKEDTVLISIMTANNEIGTIEPIGEIGRIARKHGVIFHTDAVQAFGHIALDVNDLGIDLLSASSHKINGPKGTGLLYVRKGVKLSNLIHGGMQERGLRGGTENIPGIMGFAKAAEIAHTEMNDRSIRMIDIRDYLILQILERIPYTWLNGHNRNRLANNVNISFKYIDGESLVLELSRIGICCSSGAACDSGSVEPSHVLKAIGLSHEDASGSIRMSIDSNFTKNDADAVIASLESIVSQLRKASPEFIDSLGTEL